MDIEDMVIVEENTNLEIPGEKVVVIKKRYEKKKRKNKRENSIRSQRSSRYQN